MKKILIRNKDFATNGVSKNPKFVYKDNVVGASLWRGEEKMVEVRGD